MLPGGDDPMVVLVGETVPEHQSISLVWRGQNDGRVGKTLLTGLIGCHRFYCNIILLLEKI